MQVNAAGGLTPAHFTADGYFVDADNAPVGATLARFVYDGLVDAAGLYHNRNRWYDPALGRFVQREMNESALPVLAVLAMNGAALDAFLSGFEPVGYYGDGANLYRYIGADPINDRDPSGMFSLLGMLGSMTSRGMQAYNTYEAVGYARRFVAALMAGTGLHAVMTELVVELAMDRVGGKLLDAATSAFRFGKRMFGSLWGKGRKGWTQITDMWGRGRAGGGLFRGVYKSFTRGNFRHNLKVLTRVDAPSNVQAHHVLPISHQRHFDAVGINIHEPKWGAWWDGSIHPSSSSAYRKDWNAFFQLHPRATAAQVQAKARELADIYGFSVNF